MQARRDQQESAPTEWRDWLATLFPTWASLPPAEHHVRFWEWLWAIEPGLKPRPFVGIWPRGGGKSTVGELGVVALGARGICRYAVVVSSTQDQADKRVANIAALLEQSSTAHYYPGMAKRALTKFGKSKAWRRNRLITDSGFVVDALGLDTAVRGAKVEDQRPDLIVLDDVDQLEDSIAASAKRVRTLTQTVLPLGTPGAVVIALQNLIIPHGFFADLARGRADCLIDRIVSGPIPAIEGLEVERVPTEDGLMRTVIKGGRPTWEGQGIEECQQLIDRLSFLAFLREQQHEVDDIEGSLWSRSSIQTVATAPEFVRVVIGVDPSGGKAEIGIVAAGITASGQGYVIADESQPGRLGTAHWAQRVEALAEELGADLVVAESNFGGDMVLAVLRSGGLPRSMVKLVSSSRGKRLRAEPVSRLYSDGRVVHVGSFPALESEMTGWVPGDKSPNRLDALVFAITELLVKPRQTSIVG